jgi:type VI secretion system protein ImpJ
MPNLPVHWHEGMFLRPHHFQAADRYWAETLQASEKWDHAYNYGLRSFDYSKDALANSKFLLRSCSGRLPDGTLVTHAADQLDLADDVQNSAQLSERVEGVVERDEAGRAGVRIYLALPRLNPRAANVARGKDADAATMRYRLSKDSHGDESSGGNEQEIEFRRPNLVLRSSGRPLSGCDWMPIAEVRRGAGPGGTLELSGDYIPPLLAVDAWEPLKWLLIDIYHQVGERIDRWSKLLADRGTTLASQEPPDVRLYFMLSHLNESYAALHLLTQADGVHPFAMYVELCRLVGKLAIFGKSMRPPEIPKYDHDNLAYIFKWVRDRIAADLVLEVQQTYEQRYFERMGVLMRVTLKQEWLQSGWDWYVGVRSSDLAPNGSRVLLEPGTLNWKLGSDREVESIFQRGRQGVRVTPLDQAPRLLPELHWDYYKVAREGPDWPDIEQAGTLALRFSDKFTAKSERGAGNRVLTVVHLGRQINLEFCLFAYRRPS